MKKLIVFVFSLMIFSSAFCQNGHIKFMGIEVNGQISTLEQRLDTKGFSKTKGDMYKGKFSGYDVKLKVTKTVKSKTVYEISVVFGPEVSKEDLQEMAISLKEKYAQDKYFENTRGAEVYQCGIETPEGMIVLDFDEKTLSYRDKANIKKNKLESRDDL